MSEPKFTVIEHSRNIHQVEIEVDGDPEAWEHWVLLASDRHHDNPKADWDLERKHLEQVAYFHFYFLEKQLHKPCLLRVEGDAFAFIIQKLLVQGELLNPRRLTKSQVMKPTKITKANPPANQYLPPWP